MTAKATDVLLVADSPAAAPVLASIRALVPSGGRISRVLVVGATLAAEDLTALGPLPFAVESGTATERGRLPASAPVPTSGYWTVLRAGDELQRSAVRALFDARVRGGALALYALRPRIDYVLETAVEERRILMVERDQRSTWVGTPGFFVRDDVVRACRHYDLTDGLGIASLFLEALSKVGSCRLLDRGVVCGSPLEDSLSAEPIVYERSWYHAVNRFFKPLFADAAQSFGAVPKYLQRAYLYLLHRRMVLNRNLQDKLVLGEELPGFLDACAALLRHVDDDEIVATTPGGIVGIATRLYLLRLKGSENRLSYRRFADDVALCVGNDLVTTAAGTALDIEVMDVADRRLRISCRYSFPMDDGDMRVVASYAGKMFEGERSRRYADVLMFGQLMHRGYVIDFDIPMPVKPRSLTFRLVSPAGPSTVILPVRFLRPMSRLTNDAHSYWRAGGHLFTARSHQIDIDEDDGTRAKALERKKIRALWRSGDQEQRRAAILRLAYRATRPYFRRKKIWVYFDKLYKAGDNGEYAFKYAARQRDGISTYYIIRSDVPDGARLKREKARVAWFDTLWQRLIWLNADIVFTTHINPPNFAGFARGADRWVRDLFRYRLICIQHGLSVQDLAATLSRTLDNVSVFCLASPVEAENLSRPEYGFGSEHLVMTGLTRFDGLVSDDQREILISPTWRTYLAPPYSIGAARDYTDAFQHSTYFRTYDALINHPRLLAAADANGYRITLLLHPVTSAQAPDFHPPPQVQVVPTTGETNYERVLRQASLLVTDYSGIQFDFAYMYKPVVYFQPPELPASYAEGAYRYDTMALGEICTDVESLVDTLCEYLADGCKLKDEYAARIDEFFAFHDRDNAARIYEVGRRVQAAADAQRTRARR